MTEQIHERIKRLRKQNKLSVDEIVKKIKYLSCNILSLRK